MSSIISNGMKKYIFGFVIVLFVFSFFLTSDLAFAQSSLPEGCTSTSGYSPLTGMKCNVVSSDLPAGCTSSSGYSPLTGMKCDSTASSSLPEGCTSTSGYSPLTGMKCGALTLALPVVEIWTNNNNINYGSSTTIFWKSENANSCVASGGWSGTKALSGSRYTGKLNSTKTYTITCINNFGSEVDSITINVGNTTTSSITIISPNGGEVWEKDSYKTINWTTNGNFKKFKIEVLKYPEVVKSDGGIDTDGWHVGYSTTNSFSWKVGDVDCGACTPPIPGSYKILVRGQLSNDSKINGVNSSTILDVSNSYFTITSTNDIDLPPGCTSSVGYSMTTGQSCGCNGTMYSTYSGQLCPNFPTSDKPVISGVSGPQTLNRGQEGRWTVSASDSSEGDLSYSVVWGDEGLIAPTRLNRSSTSSVQQTATFYHSYSKSGTYEPTFTVKNTSGQSAKASLSVNVMNVVSTNHNPVLGVFPIPTIVQTGQSVNLNFSATDADNDDLGWSLNWGDNTPIIGSTCSSSGNRQTGAGWTWNGNHIWNTTGIYNVKVSVSDCKGGTAEANFSMNVGGTATPSITVLSPNGGETFKPGQQITVKWKNVRNDNVDTIDIYLKNTNGDWCYVKEIPSSNTDWTFTPYGYKCPNLSKTISSGQYKVTLISYKSSGLKPEPGTANAGNYSDGNYIDSSDNYFTITAPVVKDINSVSLNSALKSQSANVLGALDDSDDQKKSETKLVESVDNSQELICGEFTMTLKKGMKNEEVKCLQKMLNEKGFKVEGVEKGMETTYFGPATLAAFKKFQASNNLEVDGVFGPASRLSLKAITQ